ncbi:MAG TPA: SAM-dependent chlorinase/fluorinase [Candidatus Krumholzibacteria bacterium]|nr:SAM-dependent chlorinase/fluorinase [Candidatus Krumholzibacteria bacterium]HPD71434.1 SAM-dependent chlorinase/fluorinase [Candidatus Krumholzibacteria bacterium]HRY41633.1 SAM-dependent chlorinase/fluorinase [Candidatus Krumholzibacteria bacterium]
MTTIALLSDFGIVDVYVAEVKAALLRLGPADLRLIDITHDVPPGDVAAGAWALARFWGQLPPGAIHLAVVDPGVGTGRPAVAAAAAGSYFVGPGNGIGAFLGASPDLRVVRLARRESPPGRAPSTTFDGRDRFAPAAARLAAGLDLAALGDPGLPADLGAPPRPAAGGCRVVWVDRFGNLITDLRRDAAAAAALRSGVPLAVAGRAVRGPVAAYAEGARDELIWYWGSGDTLEIARRGASAAALLGAAPGLVIELPAS